MASTTNNTTFEVWLPISTCGNEWRVSQQVIGPRGGKNWQRITFGIPATGGNQQMFLPAGTYKINTWPNGFATKVEFYVTDEGEVFWD